jgi:hypothetical protein
VLALETIHATRVVAAPAALDSVAWPADATVLRFAPDDAFVIGAQAVDITDEYALVVAESGYVGCWLTADELAHVAEHVDWVLPPAGQLPELAQGLVAGVPAKLYLTGSSGMSGSSGGRAALLLTNAPYADELGERLR